MPWDKFPCSKFFFFRYVAFMTGEVRLNAGVFNRNAGGCRFSGVLILPSDGAINTAKNNFFPCLLKPKTPSCRTEIATFVYLIEQGFPFRLSNYPFSQL